jgi:plastocyanin
MQRRGILAIAAAVILAAAVPTSGRASGKDGGKDKAVSTDNVTVHFGQPQPQTPDPAPVGAAVTHFLEPSEVTIAKGGSVTFVVNGGGHGIVIHPVNEETTRADIAEDLCDGNNNETGDKIVDRRNRAAVCNGTATTPTTINGVPVVVIGTQNLDYTITDGKGDLIIQPGFNVNIAATPTTPAVVINNPRLDDPTHTPQIVATSGRTGNGDVTQPGANPAGAFLTGSAAPATPGNRIKVTFERSGRYLVICMNRAHSLNDHMFGFVNVTDDGAGQQ